MDHAGRPDVRGACDASQRDQRTQPAKISGFAAGAGVHGDGSNANLTHPPGRSDGQTNTHITFFFLSRHAEVLSRHLPEHRDADEPDNPQSRPGIGLVIGDRRCGSEDVGGGNQRIYAFDRREFAQWLTRIIG